MYMSLIRPVMVRYPASSSEPTSPVCSHPSPSMAALVAEASSRYPSIMFGPRSRISPEPSIRTSNPAAARPDVRATVSGLSPGRHMVATTASVSP
jgi:hypothetical protein